MKHAAFYTICGLGLLLAACQKEAADDPVPSAERIYLRATVASRTTTRAPYYITAPRRENPLIADVWASSTPQLFKHEENKNGQDGSGEVALHTKAKFTNGTGQLLYDAVYPKQDETDPDAGWVYFVGLHPTGWTTPAEADQAGKKATRTFKGCEDVMFAPQVKGKYAENVQEADWPVFIFHHLLTLLKVSIKAESEPVSEAWGKLKSLKIKSKNTVTVDLTHVKQTDPSAPDYDPSAPEIKAEFPDAPDGVLAELDFYKTDTDQVFVNADEPKTWWTLPYEKTAPVAYVLCAPVDATYMVDSDGDGTVDQKTTEYTLLVETEHRKVEVPVDLMVKVVDGTKYYYEGSTMNRLFIINLTFKMGNNIAVSAAVTDWATGGLGSGDLNPDPDTDTGGSGEQTDPTNP